MVFSTFFNTLWFSKSSQITFEKENGQVTIKNTSNDEINIISPKLVRYTAQYMNITFDGQLLEGSGAQLRIYNRKKQFLAEADFNAFTVMPKQTVDMKYVIFVLRMKPHSTICIKHLSVDFSDVLAPIFMEKLTSKMLIVTPSYPTDGNRYFGGFVHSRVFAYKEAGMSFDLACIHEYNTFSTYTFEGIRVIKGGFMLLDDILHARVYEKILLHFFDEKYSKILDRFDLTNTQMFFWVHGPETLYRDWNYFVTGYFNPVPEISTVQEITFKEKDAVIDRYNAMPNVHWVFVSNWIREHSERLIGIQFQHYSVIPNIIDEKTFIYKKKPPEQRKKIFFVRRFDNINKYAIDVNIRAILALSREQCFHDLEFYVYGEGDCYDALVAPVKNFENVHLIKKFLTHSEIAAVHQECGIGLFATRYDAQGVSMCEAAMSGLVIVGSAIDAIKEFIPEKYHTLSEMEDYRAYAEVIKFLYENPDKFSEISEGMAADIKEHCSFDNTVAKEISLVSQPINSALASLCTPTHRGEILLTIIVPAYNVERYIAGTLASLLSHSMLNRIEILVVNDGSTDGTAQIVEKYVQRAMFDGQSVIRLINKENGGHGSTINVGIEQAQGKYLKIVDGDDILDTSELEKLIALLENETADAVLCDYYNDYIYTPTLQILKPYLFMEPGYEYFLDDLCLPGYGFPSYGLILATGTYRTKALRARPFKLSEKMFYVDMEFDAYVLAACMTAKYYPLNIYKYRIGSATQSISEKSFTKNYKQHEKVLLNLIHIYENESISTYKKEYIQRSLIIPMISSQYLILNCYLQSPKEFRSFDSLMKQYPMFYHHVGDKKVRVARKTFGFILLLDAMKKKLRNLI